MKEDRIKYLKNFRKARAVPWRPLPSGRGRERVL